VTDVKYRYQQQLENYLYSHSKLQQQKQKYILNGTRIYSKAYKHQNFIIDSIRLLYYFYIDCMRLFILH